MSVVENLQNREELLKWRHDAFEFAIGRIGRMALNELPVDTLQTIQTNHLDNYGKLATIRAAQFQGIEPDVALESLRNSSRSTSRLPAEEQVAMWQELSKSTSVQYGFSIVGRILGYAVPTYVPHCKEQGTTPTIDGLATILHHPQTFARTTAHLGNMYLKPYNNSWETAAHLKPSMRKPYPEYTPFRIVGSSTEEQHMDFSYTTMDEADMLVATTRPPTTQSHGRCPAVSVFLPKLWDTMVNDCATIPELFPADIAKIAD